MTDLTLYHNPRCSKSRGALELLEARGLTPTVVRNLETPLSATQIKALLGKLGISTETLDGLVSAATDAGALGTKLTGGGLGGCVLALASTDEDAERISRALRDAGAARTWTAAVPTA